ncbi:unnamed protein product [Blepharisma stoltei]|uniref:Synaptonemal complex protein 1 n=1 Tax=Blepharisma stoltei TaxID=1481888 RepID=A0AAU9JKV3_9CILI|nr:unnamed protein product [Blepharisma stoltei]
MCENGSFNRQTFGQFQLEKDSMMRINQYYIAQVSQMEIKISELKAHLQAKDSEIKYLSEKVQEYENNKQEKNKTTVGEASIDYEEQLLTISEENASLRNTLIYSEDVLSLKIQLDHALRMKDAFEEKYRDLLEKSLSNKIDSKFDQENEGLKAEIISLTNENSQILINLEHEKKNNLERSIEIADLKEKLSSKSEYIKQLEMKIETSDKSTVLELKFSDENYDDKASAVSQLISSPRREQKILPVSPTNQPKLLFFEELDKSIQAIPSCQSTKNSFISTNLRLSECMNTSFTSNENKLTFLLEKSTQRSRSIQPVPKLNVSTERIHSILSPKNSMESTTKRLRKTNEKIVITAPPVAEFCPNFLRNKKLDKSGKKENTPLRQKDLSKSFISKSPFLENMM